MRTSFCVLGSFGGILYCNWGIVETIYDEQFMWKWFSVQAVDYCIRNGILADFLLKNP